MKIAVTCWNGCKQKFDAATTGHFHKVKGWICSDCHPCDCKRCKGE